MYANERKKIIQEWQTLFSTKGIEKPLAEVYIEYISNLLEKDLPPIFDFKHLCLLLGVKDQYLMSMVNCPDAFYRKFEIPKKSGGVRTITAPYPSLKFVQRWIYDNILKKIPIHGCAHGFTKKRSILTNAYVHVGQDCLLKIDLKDFFPSIPLSWVISLFESFGYERHVAFYLSSLCCYEEKLAQGSPVSPAISNIVSMQMDRRLYRLAKRFNFKYSRYADDIAFSGDSISVKFIDYIKDITTVH